MGGPATKRINEIYLDLKEEYGRSQSANFTELHVLAIKKYLDEVALDRPDTPQHLWTDERFNREALRQQLDAKFKQQGHKDSE